MDLTPSVHSCMSLAFERDAVYIEDGGQVSTQLATGR